jgi:arylsulfatase A-like enzyme
VEPTQEWIDKFKGKFDMGWNAMRDQIFANQKRLGVIPADTVLTPWPDDLPKWDTLSADEKKLFARQAEVFAGYTAYTDHEIGRVIQEVEDEGKLDNTLIIYIDGDIGWPVRLKATNDLSWQRREKQNRLLPLRLRPTKSSLVLQHSSLRGSDHGRIKRTCARR